MYLIGNGKVFTRDPKVPYIPRGGVFFEGNLIREVGTFEALKEKYPQAKIIDAKNQVIMPGLINVHNHIYSSLARGLSIKNHNPKNFLDILEGLWWNLDNHLTLENDRISAQVTFLNCIENGVTTVFDHHASYKKTKGSLMELAQIAKEYKIRACLCYEVSDRNGQEEMKKAVKENVDFINYANKDTSDMIKGIMGLHASFTLSDETLRYVVEQNPENAGYHVHIAEGMDDVEDSLTKYGVRTVERLNSMGILGPKTVAGHCIYVEDKELDILKETDTMVVHNPESNMGNAVGAPDVLKIFAKGVSVGLGTDGYTNDMIESYKVANILQKHLHKDPNCAWGEIPTMLFENNAKIANRFFATPLGKIKEGYGADIIFVDYDPLTPMDENNLNSHILFGMNGSLVTTTICNGEILMKDRKLLHINKEEVMKESRKQAKDLWQRINDKR
ncbi:MAG: putative aminohydrolase SsnA [Epulopiscium sp.]|nr:putative aminohydrolase SsnA [Candidatus Epulonipiscium sp.]